MGILKKKKKDEVAKMELLLVMKPS